MNRGLTLLEICVIILVMMVLAVIILPTLRIHGDRSRRTTCASNLSQIGKAMMMYSDIPSNGAFPTNRANGRGDPLLSLGMLYRDFVPDYRIFSCDSNPTVAQLASLEPAKNGIASAHPLDATMTHYGYDSGNKGTDYKPHTPKDTLSLIVTDFTAAGRNSDNHGPNAGQNCLLGAGSVEWRDTIVNPLSGDKPPIVVDRDITSDGTLPEDWKTMKSYISQ